VTQSAAHPPKAAPWGLLCFLLLLHVINQIDRQLVAGFAIEPEPIRVDRGPCL
jgi:hypothetical protein